MIVFVIVVAVLLVGFAVAATTGRLGPGLEEPTSSQASFGLPDVPVGHLRPRAVEEVRLDQALRGYRMDQVDAVLDRLSAELAARDAELAALRQDTGLAAARRDPHGAALGRDDRPVRVEGGS